MQIAYGAEERVWFSFMMDGTTCIEVKALDFEHAVCVLEILRLPRHPKCPVFFYYLLLVCLL